MAWHLPLHMFVSNYIGYALPKLQEIFPEEESRPREFFRKLGLTVDYESLHPRQLADALSESLKLLNSFDDDHLCLAVHSLV